MVARVVRLHILEIMLFKIDLIGSAPRAANIVMKYLPTCVSICMRTPYPRLPIKEMRVVMKLSSRKNFSR